MISALRIALNEAETRDDYWWKIHVVNRWIDRLAGVAELARGMCRGSDTEISDRMPAILRCELEMNMT